MPLAWSCSSRTWENLHSFCTTVSREVQSFPMNFWSLRRCQDSCVCVLEAEPGWLRRRPVHQSADQRQSPSKQQLRRGEVASSARCARISRPAAENFWPSFGARYTWSAPCLLPYSFTSWPGCSLLLWKRRCPRKKASGKIQKHYFTKLRPSRRIKPRQPVLTFICSANREIYLAHLLKYATQITHVSET